MENETHRNFILTEFLIIIIVFRELKIKFFPEKHINENRSSSLLRFYICLIFLFRPDAAKFYAEHEGKPFFEWV